MVTALQVKTIPPGTNAMGAAGADRQRLLDQANEWHEKARRLAANGEVVEAGALILKGLDFERRARARGPQVLGVIKRRV
ncbi:MAG: hypothetical protein ACOYLI_01925 [Synechococcus lacustris]|jgi:hypothetical protein